MAKPRKERTAGSTEAPLGSRPPERKNGAAEDGTCCSLKSFAQISDINSLGSWPWIWPGSAHVVPQPL